MSEKKDSGIVNIHGKQYQTVALRVSNFRGLCPDYTLQTEIISRDEDCVVMKATILNKEGRVIATGHSEEYRGSSTINKTSALENAETSAIGRALAAFGMGGTEFASADEVAHAITAKASSKGHSPSDGAFEALSKEDQAIAQTAANSILDLWREDKELAAYEAYYQQGYSNEMLLGIWELLRAQSQLRNKLKTMHRDPSTKKAA